MIFKYHNRKYFHLIFGTFILTVISFIPLSFTYPDSNSDFFENYQNSDAYKRYISGQQSEFSKLIFMIDSLKNKNLKLISDGHEFNAYDALKDSKKDLLTDYRNEKANYMIQRYFYRSDSGEIMYLKFPNGELKPLRDVLLARVKKIEQLSSKNRPL